MNISKYRMLVADVMCADGYISEHIRDINIAFIPKGEYHLLNTIHPFPVIEYPVLGVIDVMVPHYDKLETYTYDIKHKSDIVRYAFFYSDVDGLCGYHYDLVDVMHDYILEHEHKTLCEGMFDVKWCNSLPEHNPAKYITKHLRYNLTKNVENDCGCDDWGCDCELDVDWYSPIIGYDDGGLVSRENVGNGIHRDWVYTYNYHNKVQPATNIQFGNLNINKPNQLDNLYLIHLHNKTESFIKVGRTFSTERRFKDFERVGYTVDVLSVVTLPHINVCAMEDSIKFELSDGGFLYEPKIPFGGSKSECFILGAKSHNILELFI